MLERAQVEQQGFGLIEVLVSLLILTIGLLGMASLQTRSLQMTTGSQSQTQAILLAEDIVERMRANRSEIDDYAFDGDPVNCDSAFTIDNTSVADNDLAEWRNGLACLLPGGNGEVAIAGRTVTVTVTWDVRGEDENLDEGELVLEVNL